MSYVFTNKQKKKYVFIFILVIIVMIISIFLVNNRNVFLKKEYYNVIIRQYSRGIRPGNEVVMNGFVIGYVTSVKLQEDDSVLARVYIYKDYASSIRKDTRVFPLSLLTKTELIVKPNPESSYPVLPQGSTLYAMSIWNVEYSSEYNADAGSSIEALALHVDLIVKTILNPDYGINIVMNDIEFMQNSINKENLSNWASLISAKTVTNIISTGKMTSLTLTNINKILQDFESFRNMYERKKGNIENTKVNFDFAITNIMGMAKDMSLTTDKLNGLVNKLEEISNTIAIKKQSIGRKIR